MIESHKPALFKFHTAVIVSLFIFIHPAITKAKYNKNHNHVQKKIIVLDPGHGGYDKGAQGPDGTLEKNVTMELARVLASKLENTYTVIFTRTDDYRIDIPKRTAMANHLNADLFISIHCGGSFLHQASGISLYYYEKVPVTALMLEAGSIEGAKNSNVEEIWSNIQVRHQENSKVLAQRILNIFKGELLDKIGCPNEIQGAPLMVLEGADMPAVLIEIGYITNPKEEKSLNDINVLSDMAQRIKHGIDDYFEKAP